MICLSPLITDIPSFQVPTIVRPLCTDGTAILISPIKNPLISFSRLVSIVAPLIVAVADTDFGVKLPLSEEINI